MKGKEQAADEQPMLSAERCFNKTWLERAMERMERRLQVTIHSSLEPIMHNMSNLKGHVMAVKEGLTSREANKQEDNDPLESGRGRVPFPTDRVQANESRRAMSGLSKLPARSLTLTRASGTGGSKGAESSLRECDGPSELEPESLCEPGVANSKESQSVLNVVTGNYALISMCRSPRLEMCAITWRLQEAGRRAGGGKSSRHRAQRSVFAVETCVKP